MRITAAPKRGFNVIKRTDGQHALLRKAHSCAFFPIPHFLVILSPREALDLMSANLKHSAHRFWPADINLATAVGPFHRSLVGHRQVSDAYLLGLALHHRGTLATMDRAIRDLLAKGAPREVVVEI